jgi:VCPO second helical-bundle domain
MLRRPLLAGSLLCGFLCWANPAVADVVVDWNLIATQAVVSAGAARPGPSGLIDVAMVQLAMHDAVQAFQGRFESYGGPIANASGSPVAAVARAARDVLIGVGLTTTANGGVDTLYTNYLSSRGLTNDAGLAAGQQAAAHILALRVNNDGRVPANAEQFFGGTGAGEWRPTSLDASGQPLPMVAAYLRSVLPFTLKDASQFRQEPFPKLTSGKYADEYNEVKALGSLNGSSRRPSQTDAALFFADNAVLYWNRALRSIADSDLRDSGDIARMFALVDMAMADALIGAWDSKRHFNFWRPLTAIRLGDSDGNDNTAGDPTWTPFIATPNYPEYTSGANNLSGSATTMLANFFGSDKHTFTMTSTFVHPTTGQQAQNPRVYSRFSEPADDIVDARIYEGIHFRSADEDARSQGKHVANWAFAHFLRPLH